MFHYVSGANYFGETLEWIGFSLACWTFAAFAFAFFTAVFLGSRAIRHHRYIVHSIDLQLALTLYEH